MAWVFDPMTGEIRFDRNIVEHCTIFRYRLQILDGAHMTIYDSACVTIRNGDLNQQSTITTGQVDIGL